MVASLPERLGGGNHIATDVIANSDGKREELGKITRLFGRNSLLAGAHILLAPCWPKASHAHCVRTFVFPSLFSIPQKIAVIARNGGKVGGKHINPSPP
jgi:hypothetical protein